MKIGAFLLVLFLVTGCSTDNYIYPPPEVATFNLFIENSTTSKIAIYLQGTDESQGFESRGNLAVGEEMEILDLSVLQTYILRAAISDSSAEDYFYQQIILRDSPTDVFLFIE